MKTTNLFIIALIGSLPFNPSAEASGKSAASTSTPIEDDRGGGGPLENRATAASTVPIPFEQPDYADVTTKDLTRFLWFLEEVRDLVANKSSEDYQETLKSIKDDIRQELQSSFSQSLKNSRQQLAASATKVSSKVAKALSTKLGAHTLKTDAKTGVQKLIRDLTWFTRTQLGAIVVKVPPIHFLFKPEDKRADYRERIERYAPMAKLSEKLFAPAVGDVVCLLEKQRDQLEWQGRAQIFIDFYESGKRYLAKHNLRSSLESLEYLEKIVRPYAEELSRCPTRAEKEIAKACRQGILSRLEQDPHINIEMSEIGVDSRQMAFEIWHYLALKTISDDFTAQQKKIQKLVGPLWQRAFKVVFADQSVPATSENFARWLSLIIKSVKAELDVRSRSVGDALIKEEMKEAEIAAMYRAAKIKSKGAVPAESPISDNEEEDSEDDVGAKGAEIKPALPSAPDRVPPSNVEIRETATHVFIKVRKRKIIYECVINASKRGTYAPQFKWVREYTGDEGWKNTDYLHQFPHQVDDFLDRAEKLEGRKADGNRYSLYVLPGTLKITEADGTTYFFEGRFEFAANGDQLFHRFFDPR